MFGRRGKASSTGQATKHAGEWPQVSVAVIPRLDDLLQRLCAEDDLEILGRHVDELHHLSGTSFLDRSRSSWTWLTAYAAEPAIVPPLLKLRVAFFCHIWNENIRSQAYAWGLILGYPSEQDVRAISTAALDDSTALDPQVVVAQGDTVGDLRMDLAHRLGRPLPTPASTEDAHHLEVLQRFNQLADDGSADDAASRAYATGTALAASGDALGALPHLEEAGRLGLDAAMFDAGCVHSGLGDHAAATVWWEAAAAAGNVAAVNNLGCAEAKRGNRSQAERWFLELMNRNDVRGCRGLAQLAIDSGERSAALDWFRRGAGMGDVPSMVECGRILGAEGLADLARFREGAMWAERAAQSGDADGMFMAGIAHAMLDERGEAQFWLSQAEIAGHPRAGIVKRDQGL